MKIKVVLGVVVAIIFAAIVTGAVWWELRKQVITFDDGSELTLLGADYGRQHKSPEINVAGGVLRSHSIDTSNNTLVVWIHLKFPSKAWRNFQYYVYDKANTACVANSIENNSNTRSQNQIVGVQFDAFPRRQSSFYLRVQENSNDGQEMADQKFVVSNPAQGPFMNMTGALLPDTEEDGTFSATLKKLVAHAKMPFMRNNDADDTDPINQGVQATFGVKINGTNADNWQPVSIETSDGTGNSITGWLNGQQQGDDYVASYQYGLWTDEPAWKLRVEFSKQSDFNDDELWTVPGIPAQASRYRDFWSGRRGTTAKAKTTAPFAETDLGSYHLSIFPVKQFTDMANSNPQGGLTVEVDPAPAAGMRLTLVKFTDDQGDDIQHWDYGSTDTRKGILYRYGLQDLQGGTNFNLTIAFHKSHFVEFTAKPEIATADSSDQSN